MNAAEFLLARIDEQESAARAAMERNGGRWTAQRLEEWDEDNCRITGTLEPGNPRGYSGDRQLWEDEGALGMFGATAQHIAYWDPTRVLVECAAKRAIVGLYREVRFSWDWEADQPSLPLAPLGGDGPETYWDAVCALAAAYADHPDFDHAWVAK